MLAAVNWKYNYSSPISFHRQVNETSPAIGLATLSESCKNLPKKSVSNTRYRKFGEFWEKSRSTTGQFHR